ncbi:Aspartic proteinase-like protein 2 [Dendrobium catenatum]|uniref:Aspartic proteinase-like protein 2 n=1 Tax=Dendrobium catenatum TaxID=906689 RepID=A0A2I0WCY7_9ASPA|nr:Aspartic proteinase-like protein 2 [Dendrobium catenatum]
MEEEEEKMNASINIEVVYMVRHTNTNEEAYYDDDEDETINNHRLGKYIDFVVRLGPSTKTASLQKKKEKKSRRIHLLMKTPLADMRKQMRREMRARDREISQLNEKMTEMMARIGAMIIDAAFPKITFFFENSVELQVYPHDYFFENGDGIWCTGFQNSALQSKDGKDIFLLGGIHWASHFSPKEELKVEQRVAQVVVSLLIDAIIGDGDTTRGE